MANKTNIGPKLPLYYSGTTEEIIINGVKKISEFDLITSGETLSGLTFDVLKDGFNRQLPFSFIEKEINKIHYIEKTYDEMIAMQTNNQFVINQNYLITDYRTTYNQPTTNIPMGGVGQENENPIEQILVTALSPNQLANECASLSYPQDIVYYNLNDNTEGFTKGKIYRRIDTLQRNDIGTDWRHIKYRRYKLNVTNEWASGSNYNVGDVVVNNGDIYYCFIADSNSGGLTNKWNIYPFSNGSYAGFTTINSNRFYVGNSTKYYIPVNNTDFQDSYLFESYNSKIVNCEIKTITLNNIKIFGEEHDDIFINDMSRNININDYTYHIKIDEECDNINIGMYCYPITIMSDCSYIIIGDDCYQIEIGSWNEGITLGLSNYMIETKNDDGYLVVGKNAFSISFGSHN